VNGGDGILAFYSIFYNAGISTKDDVAITNEIHQIFYPWRFSEQK
jgi:hypothetical protein